MAGPAGGLESKLQRRVAESATSPPSWKSSSFWLLERVVGGQLPISISVALALEYEAVLLRPAMLAQGWASADQVSAVLDAVLAQAVLVQPIQVRRRPALRDPSGSCA